MNTAAIIGHLTRDPELRNTQNGIPVCTFTVAVNRRNGNNNEADFFRVSAWRQLAEVCNTYLKKGKKVYVAGSVSARGYISNDGEARASLELNAREVEFLTSRGQDGQADHTEGAPAEPEFIPVDDSDNPF